MASIKQFPTPSPPAEASPAPDTRFERERERLRQAPRWALLDRVESDEIDGKFAAHNIRRLLKVELPSVRFSVRRPYFGTVVVAWTDGPTVATVQALIARFQRGHFHGEDDCYRLSADPWPLVFGGARHLQCQRDFGTAFLEQAIDAVFVRHAEALAGVARPSAERYRAGALFRVAVPGNNDDLQALIRRAAYETSA